MPGLWHTEFHANPTLALTGTQVLSQEPLQPNLLPRSLCLRLMPADTQSISCHRALRFYFAQGSHSLGGRDARHRASHHAQRVPTFTGSEARSAGASCDRGQSWQLCEEHRMVLHHPQSQPLLPGERTTRPWELQEPSKYWGSQGYGTGSP